MKAKSRIAAALERMSPHPIAEAILAAIQRLYLPPEADHPTGAIDLAAIRAMLGA